MILVLADVAKHGRVLSHIEEKMYVVLTTKVLAFVWLVHGLITVIAWSFLERGCALQLEMQTESSSRAL